MTQYVAQPFFTPQNVTEPLSTNFTAIKTKSFVMTKKSAPTKAGQFRTLDVQGPIFKSSQLYGICFSI
jgi:hypothetical protein